VAGNSFRGVAETRNEVPSRSFCWGFERSKLYCLSTSFHKFANVFFRRRASVGTSADAAGTSACATVRYETVFTKWSTLALRVATGLPNARVRASSRLSLGSRLAPCGETEWKRFQTAALSMDHLTRFRYGGSGHRETV